MLYTVTAVLMALWLPSKERYEGTWLARLIQRIALREWQF